LFLIACFLVVFIPLYPKIPLADVLPGYIVRVRLEDLLVAAAAAIYAAWWIRGKANPKRNPLFWLIIGYLGVGLVSGIAAVTVTGTIPPEGLHLAKWFLHWVRRAEYAFLVFLLADAVRTRKQLAAVAGLIVGVIIAAGVYGFGQKYYQWPVYSTMNREFAKGWRLVLTEHARVPSTFAGHYDLGAFLVLALPLTLMLIVAVKPTGWRVAGFLGYFIGYTLLILTASRASFIAYAAGTIVLFGLLVKLKPWKRLLGWLLTITAFSAVLFLTFGDLSGRFAHVLNMAGIRGMIEDKVFRADKTKPKNYLTLTDQLALVADKTDIPPIRFREQRTVNGEQIEDGSLSGGLPPDVYEEVPDLVATVSATGEATFTAKPRQYSAAAFTYGLSSAIRFDVLWPRALAGWKKNLLLGSGYSTLSKAFLMDFTEAESTDNDYLRSLGETGILGFLTFFGTIVYLIYWLFVRRPAQTLMGRGFQLSVIAGTVGLLVNASYIDVFEASKVAFAFWALAGMGIAAGRIHENIKTLKH
jgi:hypothetical protein